MIRLSSLTMPWTRRAAVRSGEVEKTLDLTERELVDLARRVRVVELEAGIFEAPYRRQRSA